MSNFSKGLKAFGRGFKEGVQNNKEKNIDYKIKETEQLLQEQKVNHILHLLLSIITAGFWIIAWILVVINVSSKKSSLQKKLKELYKIKEQKSYREQSQAEISTNRNNGPLDEKDKTELKSLVELKDLGVISHKEFEEKKNIVLSKYSK